MSEPKLELHTCQRCGHAIPAESLICPCCHTRVARNFWTHPPRWFIVLLLLIIAGLAAYAAYLAYQVLVAHNY